MTDKDNQPTGSLFERCVTRREMLLTTGGALAGVLLVGCGGGEGAQEAQTPAPVAGNFVGEVSDFAGDPEAVPFVAVVAASPEGEGEEREVRAYLCDGQEINEWFTGTAEGNDLDLTSDGGGARLEGSLASEAATGTTTLDDGQSFTFTADLATGIAGLYNVTISEDRQVRGTSETGNRLEGQVAEEPQLGSQGQLENYPITATITSPDGETFDFELLAAELELPEEARWIVLADGTAKGARKGVPSKSGGAGFTCPIIID